MNKITCNVIKDILPLYADNVVSGDTRELVDEHLSHCKNCRNVLEKMKQPVALPDFKKAQIHETEALKGVKRRIFKQKLLIAILLLVCCVFIVFLVFSVKKNYKDLSQEIRIDAAENILRITMYYPIKNYSDYEDVDFMVIGKTYTGSIDIAPDKTDNYEFSPQLYDIYNEVVENRAQIRWKSYHVSPTSDEDEFDFICVVEVTDENQNIDIIDMTGTIEVNDEYLIESIFFDEESVEELFSLVDGK